jgi:large repetitive protein
VKTISVGSNISGLARMASSSDNKYLFITAPSGSDGKGHILVVDVNSKNKGVSGSHWQKEVADIVTELGVTGIATAPAVDSHGSNFDQIQMVITNRSIDTEGFGVITVKNGNLTNATIHYTKLSLGSALDYFDVNEAVDVAITGDGRYAFVAARNSRNLAQFITSVDADPRAGSNIGIITNPLTSQAKLVAATLPIPNGWVRGLTLSADDKILTAAYQGLGAGTIFAFDVAAIDATIENADSNILRVLEYLPIDDLNPAIDQIGADFHALTEDNGNYYYGVPENSKSPPLFVGGNTFSATSANDWLKLNPVSSTGYTEDLTPTFEWDFANDKNVNEVNLFVSTFDLGAGLLPWDRPVDVNSSAFLSDLDPKQKEKLITKSWHGYQDYNPGRILTATWNRKTDRWTLPSGDVISLTGASSNTHLVLPEQMQLTAGSTYYWAVQATDNRGRSSFEKNSFQIVVPKSNQFFKSVTVLTHGFNPDILDNKNPGLTNIPDSFYQLGNSIVHTTQESGLMLRYDRKHHTWVPTDEQGQEISTNGESLSSFIESKYLGKSLVLLTDWSQESVIPNSGFTEAVADETFAAMVSLDQMLGGSVGEKNANGQAKIYDGFGNLIRNQGNLFNSPLHFIGFSRGTVVNSEVIQRLGTYFPGAGGRIVLNDQGEVVANPDRDLQMTTIDPHDFEQGNLNKGFLSIINDKLKDYSNFYEPQVKVWSNVTFADNYYQTRADASVFNVFSATPNGRIIEGADINQDLTELTGFKYDNGLGNTHTRALAWYAGTLALNAEKLNVKPGATPPTYTAEEQPIYDALGSKALIGMNIDDQSKLGKPWYKRSGVGEGIGEGWAFSVLGGGKNLRLFTNVPREDLKKDNTATARQRGDFAVPTLFNGNFDAIFDRNSGQPLPGWTGFKQDSLKTWAEILPGSSPDRTTYSAAIDSNYAIELHGGDSLVHNNFVVLDWGVLRFDAHISDPDSATSGFGNAIHVYTTVNGQEIELQSSAFQGVQTGYSGVTGNEYPAVDLRRFELTKDKGATETLGQANRVGFAEMGFQTFQLDLPNEMRGKIADLKFRVSGNKTVYLDNIFLKSKDLLLGSPQMLVPTVTGNQKQEARKDIDTPKFDQNYKTYIPQDPFTQFGEDYLLEKPQYSLSYNAKLRTANWVAYQLNNSWLGNSNNTNTTFQNDPRSPFAIKVGDSDIPKSSGYHKGHMTASADRSRNEQDNKSTYLMSNVLPQTDPANNPNSRWTQLEKDLRDFVKSQNKELYIIVGRHGQAVDQYGKPILLPEYDLEKEYEPNNPSDIPNKVSVPESVWKVVLVLDRPGQGIADVTKDTLAFAVNTDNINIDPDKDWTKTGITANGLPIGLINIDKLEEITGYDFLSNLTTEIQESIEGRKYPDLKAKIAEMDIFSLSSPLLASEDPSTPANAHLEKIVLPIITESFDVGRLSFDRSIGHDRIPNYVATATNATLGDIDILKVSIDQDRSYKFGARNFRTPEIGSSSIHIGQIGSSQVGFHQTTVLENSSSEFSSPQDCPFQSSILQNRPSQVSSSQVSIGQVDVAQISTSQFNSWQLQPFEIGVTTEANAVKVAFPSFIGINQFFTGHKLNSIFDHLTQLQSTLATYWNVSTNLNLTFNIANLPVGQLAEATIAGYDSLGRPNAATITLDNDANGVGWFIDTTPDENSEFTTQLATAAYQATINSPAYGKYDLLTTILHETGHALGIINGYSEFDKNVKNSKFITDTFSAQLTPDGSHLDSSVYPYDLLNTSLKPGIRKLPSQLDLAIINQLYSNAAGQSRPQQNLNAALTAGALYAIENGDFTTTTGWNLQGGTTIGNGAATLSEASQKLAQLTQDLIIPTGAKRLQFTIKDNHLVLGDSSKTANDAFEVALLGTNFKPLAGTSQGLSNTDSLLNIQANGTIYKSNKVTITSFSPTSQIVTIDISDITPETSATLYFNLLGFGAKTSTVTIDDIKIFSAAQPIANPDQIVTNQNTPVAINPALNDSNVVGIQIIDRPTHGTLTQNPAGQIIYRPTGAYVGTDRFTYIGFNSEGSISNPATVDIVVNNLPPSIDSIIIPTSIKEGQLIQLSAAATDNGSSDLLTYSWNLGDGSAPISGQQINHTFTDNGTYNAILTVTDQNGGVSEKAIEIKVDNVAPTITNIVKPTIIKEGESVAFSSTATDPGTLDTLTYSWNFGDNTNPQIGQNVNHTFADNGSYTVILTVTDKDSGVATQNAIVQVDNVNPVIVSINKPAQIKEGQSALFSAVATDAGTVDTLTYSWNFGDGTNPIVGQNFIHTFADNGSYTVILSVTDKDGGVTTQNEIVQVDNVNPVIVSINKPAQIKEGQSALFGAVATDAGTLDTLTYSWNFGDGTNLIVGQNVNHTFADNGSYTVILSVTDKDGGITTQNEIVQVDNVAPTIVNITKPPIIKEGEAATFNATATDPGTLDTLTYSWNFGDTTTPQVGQTVKHTFADNGNYNVILTVTDKDSAVTTQTVVIKVDNVAPSIVNIAKPTQINEGQLVAFTATATDPSINDTLTYSWNFGDSTSPVSGQTVNHTFADNGTYNVILTVTDKDGAATAQTVAVKVDNVAPTIANITKPTIIKEGEAATFSATATDPGTLDTLTYSWNFGDNTNSQVGQTVNHTFADNGNYNVILTVTDKDGAVTTQTVIVKVDNVAPIITGMTLPQNVVAGTSAQFTATASDQGTRDILTYSWNFGDNTAPVQGQTITRTFTTPGSYNITLTVTDQDGAVTTQTQTLLVAAAPSTSTSGIRSGAKVTLSGSVNLDGNVNSRTDDTKIYAATGVNINGNITLPIKRDAAGNPLKDANGKFILIDNSITTAPGASNSTSYSNINTAAQTITIPSYNDIKQQSFNITTTPITFDISQKPINTAADWTSKFPPAGTTSNPTVVRIINGNFNLPANITLNNYIIIVENGNININQGNPTLNNVTFIANNGDVNLNSVSATNLKLSASGNINFNGNTTLNGSSTINSNGNTTLNGNTNTIGNATLKIVAQGNVAVSGNTTLKGQICNCSTGG